MYCGIAVPRHVILTAVLEKASIKSDGFPTFLILNADLSYGGGLHSRHKSTVAKFALFFYGGDERTMQQPAVSPRGEERTDWVRSLKGPKPNTSGFSKS